MEEIEAIVEGVGIDARDFYDAADGHLVDQQFEYRLILVGSFCRAVALRFCENVLPQTLQRQRGLPMAVLPKDAYAPGSG